MPELLNCSSFGDEQPVLLRAREGCIVDEIAPEFAAPS
jgi:hypothetical protein